MKHMELKQYIQEKGDDECAILFNVKPRTAASWRRGERMPRPDQANQIVQVTNGVVTLNGIYNKAQ
jgi:hypothetical protein